MDKLKISFENTRTIDEARKRTYKKLLVFIQLLFNIIFNNNSP